MHTYTNICTILIPIAGEAPAKDFRVRRPDIYIYIEVSLYIHI